jgi:hypothetical protein
MPTLDENYWDIQEGSGIKFFYAIPDMTLLQKGHLATEGTEFLIFFLLFSLCAYYPVGCGRTGFCSGLRHN